MLKKLNQILKIIFCKHILEKISNSETIIINNKELVKLTKTCKCNAITKTEIIEIIDLDWSSEKNLEKYNNLSIDK